MSNEGKLFVGGLSFDTTEESLTAAFKKYGTIVHVDVIRDRETGRSRGFGFVTFADPADARDAKENMNGKTIDGRDIRVDEAARSGGNSGESGSRGSRGGGFSRGGGGYSRSYGENRGQDGYGRGGTSYDSSYGYSGNE